MRLTCTLVLGALLSQAAAQEPAKPKVLDWSYVPAQGDKDWTEQRKRLHDEYHGKEVIVEGIARPSTNSSSRLLWVEIVQPARRGELTVLKGVMVVFHDVRPASIQPLLQRKIRVKGMADTTKTSERTAMLLDNAKVVPVAKKR